MSIYYILKQQAAELLAQAMGPGSGEAPTPGSGNHAFFAEVIQMVQTRGLGSLAQSFQDKGLGQVVQSWIGRGENLPISASDLTAALGTEQVAALANKLGLPLDQASGMLAKLLPQLVDRLTPNGFIEEPAAEESEADAQAAP